SSPRSPDGVRAAPGRKQARSTSRSRPRERLEPGHRPRPAPSWRLYRDGDKLALGTTPLVPDAPAASYVDRGAIPGPPALDFYRLKGLSPCSRTPGRDEVRRAASPGRGSGPGHDAESASETATSNPGSTAETTRPSRPARASTS